MRKFQKITTLDPKSDIEKKKEKASVLGLAACRLSPQVHELSEGRARSLRRALGLVGLVGSVRGPRGNACSSAVHGVDSRALCGIGGGPGTAGGAESGDDSVVLGHDLG